jgi:hypothetical protein
LDSNLAALALAVESRTAWLFTFAIADLGGGAVWRYTSLPGGVSYGGNTYTSAVIGLTGDKNADKGGFDPEAATLVCGRIEPLLSFAGRRFPHAITVTVVEVFLDANDVPYGDVVIAGEVCDVVLSQAEITAKVRPLNQWLRKRVPAVVYSPFDQRQVYGAGFGVDKQDFKAALTVASIAQNTITVAGPLTANHYDGGYIAYERTVGGLTVDMLVPVVTNTATTIVCAFVPPDLAATDAFDVYAGYDGSAGQAKIKFNNFDGFLGFPHLPRSNPVLVPQAGCKAVYGPCHPAPNDELALYAQGTDALTGLSRWRDTAWTFPLSSGMTFEFWFEIDAPFDSSTSGTPITIQFAGNYNNSWSLSVKNTWITGQKKTQIEFWALSENSTGDIITVNQDDHLTGRHHVAGVVNGADMKLFLDGTQIGTSSGRDTWYPVGDAVDDALVLLIANWDNRISFKNGRVSKVVRYTGTFTPATAFSADADTLALYLCNEGSGTTLVDASGNSRDIPRSAANNDVGWEAW